jgi:hypothetical protein
VWSDFREGGTEVFYLRTSGDNNACLFDTCARSLGLSKDQVRKIVIRQLEKTAQSDLAELQMESSRRPMIVKSERMRAKLLQELHTCDLSAGHEVMALLERASEGSVTVFAYDLTRRPASGIMKDRFACSRYDPAQLPHDGKSRIEISVHHCNAFLFGYEDAETAEALAAAWKNQPRATKKDVSSRSLNHRDHFNLIGYRRGAEKRFAWGVAHEPPDSCTARRLAIGRLLMSSCLMIDSDSEQVLALAPAPVPVETTQPQVTSQHSELRSKVCDADLMGDPLSLSSASSAVLNASR